VLHTLRILLDRHDHDCSFSVPLLKLMLVLQMPYIGYGLYAFFLIGRENRSSYSLELVSYMDLRLRVRP
jgi:hypothetical protein